MRGGKELSSRSPHATQIRAVALAADGKLLATGGEDGAIRLWELAEEQLLPRTVLRGTGAVRGLAFAPDGRTLAACGEGRAIHLWRPEPGESVGRLDAPGEVGAVAFTRDGRALAAGGLDGELTLFRAAAGEEVRREVASVTPTDPGEALRRETEGLRLRAGRKLASFHAREGDSTAQRQTLEKTLAEVDLLRTRSPERRDLQAEQVELLVELALLLKSDQKAQERLALRAADVGGKLLAADPFRPRPLLLRGRALFLLGSLHYQHKRQDQALAAAGQAGEMFSRLAERDPEDEVALHWQSSALVAQGVLQLERRQWERGKTSSRAAVAVLETRMRRVLPTYALRTDLRRALELYLAVASRREPPAGAATPGQRREAVEAFLHRGELNDQLALYTPRDVALRTQAADQRRVWKFASYRQDVKEGALRLEEADECYRRAVAHYAALAELWPQEQKYRHQRLSCLKEWGSLLEARGADDRAEKVYARLAAGCKAERDQAPLQPAYHTDVSQALQLQARVAGRQARHDDACALLRQALRESARSLSVRGRTVPLQHDRALLLRELAKGELLRKDHAAAFAALQESFTLTLDRAEDWLQVGGLLVACQRAARADGKLADAEKEWADRRYADRAMDALVRAVALKPNLRPSLETDKTWAELRQREDFKKLLKK